MPRIPLNSVAFVWVSALLLNTSSIRAQVSTADIVGTVVDQARSFPFAQGW